MIEISDFTTLDNSQKKALLDLLTNDPKQNEWPAGVYSNQIKLNYTIIKHWSSSHYGAHSNESRVRYEVLDNVKFGAGSFSRIYKSLFTLSIDDGTSIKIKKRKPGTERLVKEQFFRSSSKSAQMNTMSNEASMMQKCSFFHSKPIVWGDSVSYVVMRQLPGKNLLQIIKENDLSISERFQLTIDLLKALKEQIHDQGYVHRDIKPENILVHQKDHEFKVYIIDYGFIKHQDDDNSSECKGSPPYAAPECYKNNQRKTQKSDIYSMGRVLMYLWGDDNCLARYYKSRLEEALDPGFDDLFVLMNPKPSQQEKLRDIFKKMCEPSMEHRPSIIEIIELFNQLKIEPKSLIDVKSSENINPIEWYDGAEVEALKKYFGY